MTFSAFLGWPVMTALLAIIILSAYWGASALAYQHVRQRRRARPDDLVLLYPGKGDDLEFDIVAVHGLGANPETTWTRRRDEPRPHRVGRGCDSSKGKRNRYQSAGPEDGKGSSQSREPEQPTDRTNWLRDHGFLRTDFKRCRVLSFAYDADWFLDASVDTAKNKGVQLLRKLDEFRQRTKKKPPIIFIGHSFGGIVIKHAFCRANKDDEYRAIFKKTAGILFLGTPHQGSSVSWLGGWLARLTYFSGSDAILLNLLEHHSSQLSDLRDEFSKAVALPVRDSRLTLYSFFETRKSYLYGIPLGMIVGRDSATIEGSTLVPISRDHSGLNKCRSRQDVLYKEICMAIRKIRDICKQRIQRDNKIRKWVGGPDCRGHISHHKLTRKKLGQYGNLDSWLREPSEFKAWMDDSGNTRPTFWLRGCVGTGKTSLSSQVIEWLWDFHIREEQHMVYYYCSEDVSCDDVLRSLLLQLALSPDGTAVDRLVAARYEPGNRPRQLVMDEETHELWEKLVHQHTRVVIVVDGLDECKEPLKLLHTLRRIHTGSKQKDRLFLSSRMHIQVGDKFKDFRGVVIDQSGTREDMTKYINQEVHHSERRLLNGAYPDLERRLAVAQARRSQRMFRWAELQLAIQFLEDCPFEEVEDVEEEVATLEVDEQGLPYPL
ncbi:hypothetical protein VTK73DRAFT_8221 [Phialemonium thermophilum]|uniref:NACHT domain-containing protein n=1 Tax=Phialemonium thermophilum TaxID=223376 RepID=A0ABR3W9N8_9PEZI